MKKMKVVGLVIGFIGILGVGNVMADQATINITAEIDGVCQITGSSDISFGAINPLTATNPIEPSDFGGSAGSVTVECTNGQTVDFTPSGTYTMTSATATTDLDFTPVPPASGQTPGFTGSTYDVSATIALTDAQAAEVATDYTGSFTLTINP